MTRLCCIVEGHADVQAVPILVRRWCERRGVAVEVVRPVRVSRTKVIREGELERAVALAALKAGAGGAVLVFLDADDDRSCQLAPALLARAGPVCRGLPVGIVLAEREKEAWFLAAIESLRGRRTIREDATSPTAAETIRDAKGRLASMMARPYSATTDQPALAALVDLDLARARAPSCEKFTREVDRLVPGPAAAPNQDAAPGPEI